MMLKFVNHVSYKYYAHFKQVPSSSSLTGKGSQQMQGHFQVTCMSSCAAMLDYHVYYIVSSITGGEEQNDANRQGFSGESLVA